MFLYVILFNLAVKACVGYLVIPSFNLTFIGSKWGSENETGFLPLDYDLKQPDRVDWRTNHVLPIKDQGECDASWAFAIVGVVESLAIIHLKMKFILSEQFLIDCMPSSNGCKPTFLLNVYSDLQNNIGGWLADRDYYPYKQKKKECRWKGSYDSNKFDITLQALGKTKAPLKVIAKGIFNMKPMDEDIIAFYIYMNGPVTAAINSKRMRNYVNVSYIDEPSEEECNPKEVDHMVIIVGYNVYKGPDGDVKYWIIRNSWGTKFGDKGYYYLVRGRNACGIASDVSVPYIGRGDG